MGIGLFIIGSGCFAGYAFNYALKELLKNNTESETKKEVVTYKFDENLIVEADYIEL